jgi:nitrate reductase delta subunit
MDILKVVSVLMNYPTEQLQQGADELHDIVQSSEGIQEPVKASLAALIHQLRDRDLMDNQEEYGQLFDRGRSLSLLMFEHVHGESRDRGQAMVDLMKLYNDNGFHINVRELPDYIPLYLEYLSERPQIEALEGLDDIQHILGMLSARLQERSSAYHALFDTLLALIGAEVDNPELRELAAKEEPDNTPQALDKVWEEEAITFGGDAVSGGCPSTNSRPQAAKQDQAEAIHWVQNDLAVELRDSQPQAQTQAN